MQSEGRKEEGKAVAVVFSARARSGLSGSAFSLAPSLPFSLPLTQLNRRNRKLKPCSKFRFSSEPEPLKCCPTAESLTLWMVQEGSAVNCFIVLRSLCTCTCEYKPRVPAQYGVFSSGNLPYIFSRVMNSLSPFSGARISGCWTLRSDGR